jgi:toluene monooxygenase system protein B
MRSTELVPLHAVFATDFIAILVWVSADSTMAQVAEAVAAHVEGKRVRALPLEKIVIHHGRRLPPTLTVAQAGFKPRDHVTVEYDTAEPTA